MAEVQVDGKHLTPKVLGRASRCLVAVCRSVRLDRVPVLGCMMIVLLSSAWANSSRADVIGDRLVLSINNLPFTQRQVEVYISVKESLRKGVDKVRLVTFENWNDALKVFGDDMLILAEASRLGSFQAPDQLLDKYRQLVNDKIKGDPGMHATAQRLGIDDATIAATLDTVLRVAAFRRSKDRQAALGAETDDKDNGKSRSKSRWLDDLRDRSVVRIYEGAGTYVLLQPTVGTEAHGS